MASKFVITLACLAAVSQAAVLPVVKTAAPLAVAPAAAVEIEEYDPNPQYQYGYNVEDSLSGDSKGHVEERDGDLVRGEYSLIDADGFKRTVTYTADPVNGFNAVVRREPLVAAVAAAPIVRAAPAVVAAPAKLVAPAPVVKTVAAPLTYAAAPAPVLRASPLTYAAAPAPILRASPLTYSAAAPAAVAYRNL